PKREQIIEDNPEESELPAILRDYSDTDDLIPKPVLEKASERIEDLEGAINNILKHGTAKPCGWIPVSERLPDEGECLVLCEGHIYEVKVRVSEDEWEDKEGKTFLEQTARCDILHLGTIIIGHDECITHWMPIVLPTEKPCSMCGENPRGIPAKDGGWTTCPKCLPKENMAEFVKGIKRTGLLEAIDLIENSGTCDSLKLAVSKIKHEQDYIESQERNAAASEIIIGDLTKKIEGMEAKDGQK
ncbi:hypothetical protein LCGC14_2556890, partial [marine sediment metagenome]